METISEEAFHTLESAIRDGGAYERDAVTMLLRWRDEFSGTHHEPRIMALLALTEYRPSP